MTEKKLDWCVADWEGNMISTGEDLEGLLRRCREEPYWCRRKLWISPDNGQSWALLSTFMLKLLVHEDPLKAFRHCVIRDVEALPYFIRSGRGEDFPF